MKPLDYIETFQQTGRSAPARIPGQLIVAVLAGCGTVFAADADSGHPADPGLAATAAYLGATLGASPQVRPSSTFFRGFPFLAVRMEVSR